MQPLQAGATASGARPSQQEASSEACGSAGFVGRGRGFRAWGGTFLLEASVPSLLQCGGHASGARLTGGQLQGRACVGTESLSDGLAAPSCPRDIRKWLGDPDGSPEDKVEGGRTGGSGEKSRAPSAGARTVPWVGWPPWGRRGAFTPGRSPQMETHVHNFGLIFLWVSYLQKPQRPCGNLESRVKGSPGGSAV